MNRHDDDAQWLERRSTHLVKDNTFDLGWQSMPKIDFVTRKNKFILSLCQQNLPSRFDLFVDA